MLLKTLFKENDIGQYRAEIHQDTNKDYRVEYYGPSGSIKNVSYKNSSVTFVEDMALNWLNSIQVLNG